MKKIIAMISCITLLLAGTAISVPAENNASISGLQECMDTVLWRGSRDPEVQAKMEEDYSRYLNILIANVPTYPNYVISKMGLDPNSDTPLDQQIREEFALDYEKGVVVSSLNTFKYLNEYAKAGCFSYLFNSTKLIGVTRTAKMGCEYFSVNGSRSLDAESEKVYAASNLVIIDDAAYNYLKNVDNIEIALIEKGETTAQKAEVFGLGFLTFLYIKGEKNEYLIKVYDSDGKKIPKIEPYVLYTAVEVMNTFEEVEIAYSQRMDEEVLAEKPTFSAEATALQSEGLLKGNENGLDLLKPLTRMEATAMLLRAIGESETADDNAQVFSDVPNTHWGFGAAKNAYELGLVKGVGDDAFAPDDSVTAVQFATMVLRAANTEDFDWEQAVNILIEKGVITQENAATMDLFTRGDMAKMIYEARAKGLL